MEQKDRTNALLSHTYAKAPSAYNLGKGVCKRVKG